MVWILYGVVETAEKWDTVDGFLTGTLSQPCQGHSGLSLITTPNK